MECGIFISVVSVIEKGSKPIPSLESKDRGRGVRGLWRVQKKRVPLLGEQSSEGPGKRG